MKDLTTMSIDETPLTERTFTETHDRILHALVEQVHDMGLRLAALEAAQASPTRAASAPPREHTTIAPPAVPGDAAPAGSSSASSRHQPREASATATRPIDQPGTKTRSGRVTGWQPARR